jgi:hypothetical protein
MVEDRGGSVHSAPEELVLPNELDIVRGSGSGCAQELRAHEHNTNDSEQNGKSCLHNRSSYSFMFYLFGTLRNLLFALDSKLIKTCHSGDTPARHSHVCCSAETPQDAADNS